VQADDICELPNPYYCGRGSWRGETLRTILRTRTSRAFTLVFAALLMGSIGLWHWAGPKRIHPTAWYFWTQQAAKAGIDIRSPTRTAIIEQDAYPEIGWPSYREARRELEKRCATPAGYPGDATILAGAEWRDVRLCNSANLPRTEFEVAYTYFKSRVDENYARFYSDSTADVLLFVAGALFVWSCLFAAWLAIRWVSAAPVKG
jgi:hypothetical protein